MSRGHPTPLQKAFDKLQFDSTRTLNLHLSLPTSGAACARVETWLRGKQMERVKDVLVITGRGNHSEGGLSVVRQAVLAIFPSLRRRNIITAWCEHTAGSFVVTLAPMTALFEAPRRRREHRPRAADPPSLAALSPETLVLLRQLAVASLNLLGIHFDDHCGVHGSISDTERFVETEMIAKFSALSMSLSPIDAEGGDWPHSRYDPEAALRGAIRHALEELEDIA